MQLTSRHRRWLERRGWRTTLDYRENIVRDSGGRLIGVMPMWRAEGEQWLDTTLPPFVSATATTVDEAWRGLRRVVQAAGAAEHRDDSHPAGDVDELRVVLATTG